MRGEQKMAAVISFSLLGSSPHARGTALHLVAEGLNLGIIPACAGNSNFYSKESKMDGDHPRMRGEQFLGRRNRRDAWGSSPHARGTGHRPCRKHLSGGIIPACAGNRLDDQRRLLTQSDFTFTFQEEETQPAALSCLASAKFARFSELAS